MDEPVDLARALRAARTRMDDVRGRAESEDGLVVVEVDGTGLVQLLELDPRIYRAPDSDALAEKILATIGAAVVDATRQAVGVARETLADTGGEPDLSVDPVLRQLRLRDERSTPSWLT
jgi:DNA-binding protein YbaB